VLIWHDALVVDQLVLVNGLPGSGKSTLALALADDLRGCLLSKDQVKEALAVVLSGWTPSSLGAVAMDTIWALAQGIDGIAIVDSFWFKPRDINFAYEGIARSRASSAVEIWCDVPSSTARERYSSRVREPFHDDAGRLASEWAHWAERAAPLAITPVIRVDTTGPVPIFDISKRVRQHFDRAHT
jgi:predicted kinase